MSWYRLELCGWKLCDGSQSGERDIELLAEKLVGWAKATPGGCRPVTGQSYLPLEKKCDYPKGELPNS